MSEKITESHLSRKAVLYVRQSSTYQVQHNQESQRLQYAVEQRLRQVGWKEVEVIDEDLGRSAAGHVERTGFQRMIAEVCLGKVGVVAARELSRFARNSRDWQHLIEVCRMVDTLLMDHDGLYDARSGSDRLLLGVKGSMNEYELDLLRQRSLEARWAKARRGELVVTLPAGYRRGAAEGIEKDPDQRVQNAIRLVFQKFLEFGTVRQAMLWFIEEGMELPSVGFGPSGWETTWRRATYGAVRKILWNPVYAGAYAYGKSELITSFQDGRPCRRTRYKRMGEWTVLLPGHHEGYIEWEEFQRIQMMITKNSQKYRASAPGAAKKGAALLSGVLRCRRCGRKLMVTYSGRANNVQRYICIRGYLDQGEPKCISASGDPVDKAVSREVLRVVQPAAVEAVVRAGQEEAERKDEALHALTLELEAARYEADRARRQFDGADPENRLVVDELEHRWNRALEKVAEMERRIEKGKRQRHEVPPAPMEVVGNLAGDLEGVWSDQATDVRLKKRIVRTLIEEVIVDVDPEAGEVVLVIHWKGGAHTELRVQRRRRGQNSLHTSQDTVEAVRALTLLCPDEVIAGFLNRNGLRTGKGNRWTLERVTTLRSKRGIPAYSSERKKSEGWMNLTEASSYLGVTPKTLRRATEQGGVPSRHPLPDGPWIFKRSDLDDPPVRKRLSNLRRRSNRAAGPDPDQLTLGLSSTYPDGAV